jgi:hypothetical protein
LDGVVGLAQSDFEDTETIITDNGVGVLLDNNKNLSYQGTIYLGSGELQPIRAIFDTGSANPWILSKEAAELDSDDH